MTRKRVTKSNFLSSLQMFEPLFISVQNKITQAVPLKRGGLIRTLSFSLSASLFPSSNIKTRSDVKWKIFLIFIVFISCKIFSLVWHVWSNILMFTSCGRLEWNLPKIFIKQILQQTRSLLLHYVYFSLSGLVVSGVV